MHRIPLCCFLVTLLTSCIGFEISVAVEVDPDGTCHRRVHGKVDTGRSQSDPPPSIWSLLVEPGEPYDVVKLEQAEFSAIGDFAPGEHPSGIRRRPFADTEHFAEGDFRVEVDDLVIGNLYSYNERFESGADPIRFRAELRRWLELGTDVAIETLRAEVPDADLEGVREHVYLHLLPRVESSLLVIHYEFEKLARFVSDQLRMGVQIDGERLFSLPAGRVIQRELAKFGIRQHPEDRDPRNTLYSNFLGFWEIDATLFLELLAPIRGLPDAAKKKLAEELADRFDDLDFEAAVLRAFPDAGERERLAADFREFRVAAIGCWFDPLPVHPQSIDVRLRLPGSLLFSNGRLGRPPEVSWSVEGVLLVIRDEELRAISFAPIEGFPATGWSLLKLRDLKATLDSMESAERARLPGYVYMAMDNGWDEVMENEEMTTEIHAALRSMMSAVRYASRHAQDREGESVED